MYSVEFAQDQEVKHSLPPHGVSAQFLCAMYGAFGIELTHNLRHFTYGACDMSRIVDDVIDFPNRETPDTFDGLLDSLEAGTIPDMSSLEADRALKYVASLDTNQFAFAGEKYLEAVEVAKLRGSAPDIASYALAISREAEVQSAVLSVDQRSDRPDAQGRKQYNIWLGHFILAGYYIDSAIDLTKDHQESRAGIQPTLMTRAKLLAHSSKPLKEALRSMPAQTLPALGALLLNFNIPSLNRRFD